MSLTKPLNSKVNMKQISGADLPVIPRQPAMARYAAESTSSQTVITFPFQIDTVNGADSFILTVDGKLMTPGATNDYQFSGIDSFGFSNSVTMNFPLSAGLNIQAIKLGLKKETEFVQDARFSDLYESQDQGFQGFVRTSDLMVATATTGTPSAGQFYSTIINRASIPDLRQDLKPRMGVERVAIQNVYQLQNEFGPSTELVHGVTNDVFGQIRLVGNWSSAVANEGQYAITSTVGDYLEIVFYGTGINVLMQVDNTSRDLRASIDGGSEGSNLYPASASALLNGRNYNSNQIVSAASGLALGVHTLKFRLASGVNCRIYGFETLNESTSIKVNPGSSYLAGKKATTIGQAIFAYNSSFESGTLGTRGGRVLVYQKADGTIAKAVQPVNASQANLTSADHSNEEVARVYNPREFGAGRSDDFSTLVNSASNRVFTLDDGTTNLCAQGGLYNASSGPDALSANGVGDNFTFTFVGTGLDVYESLTSKKIVKIVSGLPYGSHVARFTVAAGPTWTVSINGVSLGTVIGAGAYFPRFIVYQPKKPTLPAGAVELADYNVMADYSDAGLDNTNTKPPIGGLFKSVTREFVYRGAGTWSFDTPGQAYQGLSGTAALNTSNGAIFEYTFVGTGVNLMFSSNSSGTKSFSIQIDGVANATGSVFGGATNGGGGAYTIPVGSSLARWISFQGLSYGKHTITVQCTDATGFNVLPLGLFINTPIHSYKSNLYADLQNSLPVGSCSISDNRQTSAIKGASLQPKAWAQAIGITSSPTTTLSSAIPMPDMSITIKTSGSPIHIFFTVDLLASTGLSAGLTIYVNGQPVSITKFVGMSVAGIDYTVGDSIIVPVSAGTHKVDLYWSTSTGTLTANVLRRILTVREI